MNGSMAYRGRVAGQHIYSMEYRWQGGPDCLQYGEGRMKKIMSVRE